MEIRALIVSARARVWSLCTYRACARSSLSADRCISVRARAPVHARVAPEESNCLYGKSDEFLSSGRLRRAAVTRGESLALSVRGFSRASPLPSPPSLPPLLLLPLLLLLLSVEVRGHCWLLLRHWMDLTGMIAGEASGGADGRN